MPLIPQARYTAIKRGMTAAFRLGVMQAAPYYPTSCTIQSSSGYDEAYAMLGKAPGMREWFGDREFGQLRSAEFVLKNLHFESSLVVDKTDVDDDRLGMLSAYMAELGESAAAHPDEADLEDGKEFAGLMIAKAPNV